MSHVVVGIVNRQTVKGIKYLLVASQKDFGQYTGFYYPPSGHVEPGESVEDALQRELYEELGLQLVSVQKLAESPIDVPGEIGHWYMCRVASYDLNADLRELKDAGFFSKEEILRMPVWPATLKFFKEKIFKDHC